MFTEFIVFTCFVVISIGAHAFAHAYEHTKSRFTKVHAHIVTIVTGSMTHPAIWAAVKEYVVHFIVYSGHVVPMH